jgi:hypothetical protein
MSIGFAQTSVFGQESARFRSAGITVVSATGTGGKAVVTLHTAEIAGECKTLCPSSQLWADQNRDVEKVSVLQDMTVSIDGRVLDVPPAAYSGMYEAGVARLEPKEEGFLVTLDGGEGALTWETRLSFDAQGMQRREDFYSGALDRQIQFVRAVSTGKGEAPTQSPLRNGRARLNVDGSGRTNLHLSTAKGKVRVSVRLVRFEPSCQDICPDTRPWTEKNKDIPLFSRHISFSINGKSIPAIFGGNPFEVGRLEFGGIAVDPRWASLRADGGGFVLRISGGAGATANFVEFWFDSRGIHRSTASESPNGPVEQTSFYQLAFD